MNADLRVVLVHGTGAADPLGQDYGTAWWQLEGAMVKALAPRAGRSLAFLPFHWTGANKESHRRQAGDALAQKLRVMAATPGEIHLVGHSHGGSVIAHALTSLALDSAPVLGRITSCTTVGTPFLRYGPRLSALLQWGFATLFGLLVLVAFVLAATGTHWIYAFKATPWLFSAWAALAIAALACVGYAGFKSSTVIATQWRERRQHDRAEQRLQGFEPRWLCLWSSEDEPTIGIGVSGSFRQPFTPTVAINEFANNLIARSLQGSDIDALELRSVGPQAMPSEHAHAPLPKSVDERLIGNANAAASVLGGTLRSILMSAKDPVFGLDDLKRIAPERVTFKELVHTTYFDDPACLDLIAHHICVTGAGSGVKCQDDLLNWYVTRWSRVTAPAQVAYPSNRVSHLVGTIVLGLAATAALVMLSGDLLARAALWPTTSRYWLTQAQGDAGPLLLYANSNNQDFSAMAHRLAQWAMSKDAKAFAVALETVYATKPGAIRMKREHYPAFVEAIGAGGVLAQWVESGFIELIADEGSVQKEVIALAGSAWARYARDGGAGTLERLEAACGAEADCRNELYSAVIEGFAVKGDARALASMQALHGADIAPTSIYMRPAYTTQSGEAAGARLSRLIDAAGRLIAIGRWNSAVRLISADLKGCSALADPALQGDVETGVAALLQEHGRRSQHAGALLKMDVLDAAIYLAGCGKLTPTTLRSIGAALAERTRQFEVSTKNDPVLSMFAATQGASAYELAMGQARRGNCEQIGREAFLQTRGILESLLREGLCAVNFVPAESVDKKLEAIRTETWRQLVLQTLPYQMRATPASAERDRLLEALFRRLYNECTASIAKDAATADAGGIDADQALTRLYHLVPISFVAAGSQALKSLDQLVAAIGNRQLTHCHAFDFSQTGRDPRKFENFLAFVKWLAPAAPASATKLEADVIARILAAGPAAAPDLIRDFQWHLLKAGRFEDAWGWTQTIDTDPKLGVIKAAALAAYATCARRAQRTDEAQRIFEQLAGSLPIVAQPSTTREVIALPLADWYADLEDWRTAFTFCAACTLTTRNAVQDRLIERTLSSGKRPDPRAAQPC